MNKKRLSYDYRRLKKIKARYFLIIGLVFLCVGIYGLRQNYSKMVDLRTAVYTADQENGDVEKALRDLRQFVYGHMNTDLSSGNISIKPPIQLKYRYERLTKTEQKKANKINQSVKEQGEQICVKQYPGRIFNSKRVNCTAKYISEHSVKTNPIPSDLYKFDFISPTWSPDLAGISLLFALIFFAAALATAALGKLYRAELR